MLDGWVATVLREDLQGIKQIERLHPQENWNDEDTTHRGISKNSVRRCTMAQRRSQKAGVCSRYDGYNFVEESLRFKRKWTRNIHTNAWFRKNTRTWDSHEELTIQLREDRETV